MDKIDKKETALYCPICAKSMKIKGDIGSKKAYCDDCKVILEEYFDGEAPGQRAWRLIQMMVTKNIL